MATVLRLTPSFRQASPYLDDHVRFAAVHLGLFFLTAFPDNEPATSEAQDQHKERLALFGKSLIRMGKEQEKRLPQNAICLGDLNIACMKLSQDRLEQLFINMKAAGGIFRSNRISDQEEVRSYVLANTSAIVEQGISALNDARKVTDIKFILGQNNHYEDFQRWIRTHFDLPTEADLAERVNRRLIATHMQPYPDLASSNVQTQAASQVAQVFVFSKR